MRAYGFPCGACAGSLLESPAATILVATPSKERFEFARRHTGAASKHGVRVAKERRTERVALREVVAAMEIVLALQH
jgi:hypothetical protein